MQVLNLSSQKEFIEKIIVQLNAMGGQDYLLMLSGGNSLKELYSKLSSNFNYPFPRDVALVDEKWDESALHPKSNELVLKNSGLLGRIAWEKSNFHPILNVNPISPEREADYYEKELEALVELYQDRIIALFGMSLEGRITGIKSESPALGSEKLVIAYETPDDYKYRITVTAKFIIECVSKVILVINSDEKCGVFTRIMEFEQDANKFPVLLLKNLKDVNVYCFS